MANAEATQVAYCLLIEGIPVAFWTNEDAASSVDVDRESAHVGLQFPTLAMGFSLADGWVSSSTARFELDDVDGTLADLFATRRDDLAGLTTTLDPGETVDNGVGQTRRSRHIGTEFIGSSGERRRYPVVKDWNVGMRHPDDGECIALGLGVIPITAKPLLWAGRRAAVYRFAYEDGAWQTWANAARIWWGTVRGTGMVRDHRWSINCDGPDSWLRRSLGYSAWAEPVTVDYTEIKIDANADDITVYFEMYQYGNNVSLYGYGTATQQIGGNTAADVRSALVTAISTALSATGDSGEFNGSDNSAAENEEPQGAAGLISGSNDIYIKIADATDLGAVRTREGLMYVTMHDRAWRSLGYDPNGQRNEALKNGNDPETYVEFTEGDGGMWMATFRTRPTDAQTPSDYDNGGEDRIYSPWYGSDSDQVYTLYAGADQEIYLQLPQGEVAYCRGQHDMPVADDPQSPGSAYTLSGGAEVDSTRLFAFIGPRRSETSTEEFTEVWIGRCSWKNVNGAIGLENATDDAPTLYVSEWLSAEDYGFPYVANRGGATMDTDWSAPAGSIVCAPLHHLTHVADGLGSSPVRLVRNMLATTGTSGGWYTTDAYTTQQFGFGGKLQPGANNLTGLNGTYPADYDIEDVGLGVPAEMIAEPYRWAALEQQIGSDLSAVYMATVGRWSSQDVALGLTRPLALCWSLRGGRYTVFDPLGGVSPNDVDHTITVEDYHAAKPSDGRQQQALSVFSPLDAVTINWRRSPVSGEYEATTKIRATDSGARYRAQDTTLDIDAPGYTGGGFDAAMQSRWRQAFDFWARRHFALRGVKLHMSPDIYPGDTVRWTDPALVSTDGTYGITGALGWITSVTHDAARETTTVDAILVDAPTAGYRMVAPSARVRAITSNVCYCDKDHWDVSVGGFEHVAVAAFAEPDWSDAGGNAAVALLQYDGNTWTTAGYQTVASVDTVANTITLSGALSGGTGYYRDRDTLIVMRTFADQTAQWVLDLYAPIADEDGAVNGDTADAVRWNED